MASNILRRSFASQAASTLKIGLIPADGIGREGKTCQEQNHNSILTLFIYSHPRTYIDNNNKSMCRY